MTRVIVAEACALVRSQRLLSGVLMALALGASAVVLLTAGRVAATQQAVLAKVDSQGTRTVVVRTKAAATGVDRDMVEALASLDAVESVTGFGPVRDAVAPELQEGPKVGVRVAYGQWENRRLVQPDPGPLGAQLWLSPEAVRGLGLSVAAGSVRVDDGPDLWVTHLLAVPSYLAELEPVALIPAPRRQGGGPAPVSSIYVLVKNAQQQAVVIRVIQQYLREAPPGAVTVTTTQAAAELRSILDGELARRGHAQVLVTLSAVAGVDGLAVLGYVLMRRRDFGRRRALGASRLQLAVLIQLQLLITFGAGALAGVLISLGWMRATASTLPPIGFSLAVGVAVTCVSTLAGLIPLVAAVRRDPIRELRVP